ncbi:hypothetical protein CEP54_011088 [Fusarium duplospermum]|uniref:Mating type protein 1-2-9 n=1 Tax=Fusarium duplospermum TaxID=1325734 RepID=A0A428PGD8_9HYPO|nr:hypothetical protein CEP54_011088 [Fusarium duplospermum]
MNPKPTLPRAVHRAPSGRTPKYPPRATNADIKALLAGPALRHLEPQPGGKWTLESRAHETILVKYSTRDGIELLRTTIHLAANPETAADLCWQHVYGYTPGQMIVPNIPHASPEAQTLTSLGVRFMNPEAPDQSHVYGQPHVGSNIHNTMPPAGGLQSGYTLAEAPIMHPIPQFLPSQHTQMVDGIEDHHPQMQHASDVPASWTLFDAPMAQPFQALPASSSPMHQVESGNCVFWDWAVPEEMHAENEWQSFLSHPS